MSFYYSFKLCAISTKRHCSFTLRTHHTHLHHMSPDLESLHQKRRLHHIFRHFRFCALHTIPAVEWHKYVYSAIALLNLHRATTKCTKYHDSRITK